MGPYVRGVLLGMGIALIIAALSACGSLDTPLPADDACEKPPYCPPDFVSGPQPVYPAH